jgi:hypothetical protein
MNYDYYNREERALCAHLFRLLHDIIPPRGNGEGLNNLLLKSGYPGELDNPDSVGIYCEVALIRDAYFARKPNVHNFMDQLVNEVAHLQNVINYRLYSDLPRVLQDPSRTHPKQIRWKAKSEEIPLSKGEKSIYGFIQAMFNAKPDLVITFDKSIYTYEAKYTQPFDATQIERTKEIATIWKNILYQDLGFDTIPDLYISTIGPECYEAEVSWEWIFELAKNYYLPEDRTYKALENAVKFIENEVAC